MNLMKIWSLIKTTWTLMAFSTTKDSGSIHLGGAWQYYPKVYQVIPVLRQA
jgi:hypothetical protein